MKQWFQDKKVALVGNAMSLFDKNYGQEIDEHDVVVRLNRAAMLYTSMDAEKSHGKRTDVWMFWAAVEYREEIKTAKCKLMHMTNTGRSYKTARKLDYYYPAEMRDAIKKFAGKHNNPSTGLMALDYIFNSEASLIDVYGFDWKKTPTFTDPDMINEKRCFHDFPAEEEFCQKTYFKSPKVFLK